MNGPQKTCKKLGSAQNVNHLIGTENVKVIPLTQGKMTVVDAGDYDNLMQYHWYAIRGTRTWYAVRSAKNRSGRSMIQMHHEIIGHPPERMDTDHIDGNGLNNLRVNLRHVTRRENAQNRHSDKKTSKYAGVSWESKRKKWSTHIYISGTHFNLGRYDKEEDARDAYVRALNTKIFDPDRLQEVAEFVEKG
jgi:hypothetical protein